MAPRRAPLRLVGAVLVAVLAVVWFTVGPGGTDDTGGSDEQHDQSSAQSSAQSSVDPASGLPWVDRADLPSQARTTLDRIAAGGPFPYSRDGVTFGNRERLLPQERSGYYREYTVPTPGEDDRGARRIVAGDAGERYWTADHYDSFSRVRGGGS